MESPVRHGHRDMGKLRLDFQIGKMFGKGYPAQRDEHDARAASYCARTATCQTATRRRRWAHTRTHPHNKRDSW